MWKLSAALSITLSSSLLDGAWTHGYPHGENFLRLSGQVKAILSCCTQIAWLLTMAFNSVVLRSSNRCLSFVSRRTDACQPAEESRQRKKNSWSVSRGAFGNGLELWFHCPLRAADRLDNGVVAVELARKATPSLQTHSSIGSVSLGMTIFLLLFHLKIAG